MIRKTAAYSLTVPFLLLAGCRAPAPTEPAPAETEAEVATDENEQAAPARAEPSAEERAQSLAAVFRGDAEAMELWNADEIAWVPYDEGLAVAAAEGRPAIVIVKTVWCPRCTQYAGTFSDAEVVEAAREFVMILADQDHVAAVREGLSSDGGYVPRTHFLAPDGTPDATLTSGRSDYAHFINPSDPDALLSLMGQARERYL